MQLLTGTSGYAYKEWKGSFYDSTDPDSALLGAYAAKLPAVEINNTFYRLPKSGVLASWRVQVPVGFLFAIKASRRITHIRRLRQVENDTRYLMTTLEGLGENLGAVLFQLPPNLHRDPGRLEAFLALLPEGSPAAFEFRHPSWHDEEIRDLLTSRGCALCVQDDGKPGVDDAFDLAAGAPWGYLRMRRERYSARDLSGWWRRIAATPWSRAFVFFKHEEGADAPKWAADLHSLSRSRKG